PAVRPARARAGAGRAVADARRSRGDVLVDRPCAPCRTSIHGRPCGASMFLRILCTALFAMSVPAIAVADTLTWPGSPGCSGTLQACIDVAVDGDRIEIATDAPITESIALHARSLTLTAADGFRPEFVGVGIIANDSGGSGDIDVR